MNATKVAGITILMSLGFLAAFSSKVAAQTTNTQTTANGQPKVIGLTGNLEADDLITVEVEHLDDWAKNPANNPAKLVPYLAGLALRGNYPEEIHTAKNNVHFHLRITPDNKKAWIDLLGAPDGTKKAVTFSVGLENQSPFDTIYEQDQVLLTVISPKYGITALIIVLVTLVILVWLARTTNLIREPGPKPIGGKLRPYNLGRTQMAFWFFLVYASYVVIWLITNALDTITPSLLGLMGISFRVDARAGSYFSLFSVQRADHARVQRDIVGFDGDQLRDLYRFQVSRAKVSTRVIAGSKPRSIRFEWIRD